MNMKKESKPRSRGTLLFSSICWTIVTVLWVITMAFQFDPNSKLTYLQIAVALLSLINAVLNWCRFARYKETNE